MFSLLTLTVCLVVWQQRVLGRVILKDAEDNEICESEDCLESANHILKWLNPDADPCEDFYEFACGNWKNLPTNERVNMSIGARKTLEEALIPELLSNPSAAKGSKYFEMLRNFMITCMDENTIQSLGVTPIKQLIQKAGGWPVLDADWSEDDWDFLHADITLGGAVIDVGTTYYRAKNSSVVTFMINLQQSSLLRKYGPGYFDLIKGLENESTKTYYDGMVEVAVTLGADKAVAEQAMKEVLEFETVFVKELIKTGYKEKHTMTFKELQEATSWLDLKSLVESYLPQSIHLSPEDKIIGEKEFFPALEKILDLYPRKTFVNYMVSKAVYPLLVYVDHGMNMSFGTDFWYERIREGQSRFEYCSKIVSKGSLGPAMATYLGTMSIDASKVAAEMTKVIIEELRKEVEETDWLDEVTRNEAAKNISEIKVDVGFPDKILDLNELGKLYEGYEMDDSNFFNAIIYDKKWVKQRDFDKIRKDKFNKEGPLEWKYWATKGLGLRARFLPWINAIDVSGPMLYYTPLFSSGNPAYVNFGHSGSIVAHELIHALDLNAKPEHHYLVLERWGSNRTEQMYDQKKQCFVDFYSSINDTKLTQKKLNGKHTLREDMADNGGLKLSLRSYRKLADQLGSPERKLPRLQQYSVEQLFMISVANAYCEIPYKQKRIEQIWYDPHSPYEFRVKGMMMNSRDFSEIFNCGMEDPMNPPEKCEVW